jgi:hypothetical protein
MDNSENSSGQSENKGTQIDKIPDAKDSRKKKSTSNSNGYIRKISKNLNVKPIIIVVVGLILVLGILEFSNINPFRLIRNMLFTEASLPSVTVTSLEDTILDIFQIATLEIESRNATFLEIVPGGFLNRGTLTVLLEYDSIVKFGVRDPQQIRMRRVGDVIFVDSSTINIEILDAYVRNFERKNTFKSNPLLSITNEVIDQILQAEETHENVVKQRLYNERNIESARRNFITTFEALAKGLGLSVIWE